LAAAAESRDLIGQAKGILIERHRFTADEAFEALRQRSMALNVKLRDVALELSMTGRFDLADLRAPT
jgi:AmiR/NasT family two-component response regulator